MSTPPLNFQRAQYAGEPVSQNECAYCGRGFTTEYYRVGGHAACPVCAQQAQSLVPPNSHKVFLHALSLGAAAAVVGCIGYAVIIILTGWTIGYAAIGVGFLIGWAMRRTAGQHGGRRYQWAAAILTYVAVSMAFVPIMLHQVSKGKASETQAQQQTPSTSATASPPSAAPTKAEPKEQKSVGFGEFVLACFMLLGFGLISPFFELTSSVAGGLLNLFIIFIGVRYAWQMMAVRTVEVDGPFEANGA
jgi:hypothetical protein